MEKNDLFSGIYSEGIFAAFNCTKLASYEICMKYTLYTRTFHECFSLGVNELRTLYPTSKWRKLLVIVTMGYSYIFIKSLKYYDIAIVTTFRLSLCLLSFISECVTNEQMHMRQRNLNQGGKYNSWTLVINRNTKESKKPSIKCRGKFRRNFMSRICLYFWNHDY